MIELNYSSAKGRKIYEMGSHKNHEYWVAISYTIFVYNEETDKLKILIEEK